MGEYRAGAAALSAALQGFDIAVSAVPRATLSKAAICSSMPTPGPLEVKNIRKWKPNLDWKQQNAYDMKFNRPSSNLN